MNSSEQPELTSSGKWSDLADDFPDGADSDRWEAPVLWIKRTYRAPADLIKSLIVDQLKKAGIENPEVVSLYITLNPGRDHAYLLLSSKKASELLIDGTINIVVPCADEEIEGKEEAVLWFDKADHLEPNEKQDPYVLYIWQLPKNRPAQEIKSHLEPMLNSWSPLLSLEVGSVEGGKGAGWAKAHFNYEFDTQKCIYLLNFNLFMGSEVRAAFCNIDRAAPSRPAKKAQGTARAEKKRRDNPRPRNKTPKTNVKSRSPPVQEAPIPTKGGAWTTVGREGRKK